MRNRVLGTSVTILAVLLLVPSAQAQGTKLKVDGDLIKSYIAAVSTDDFQGRQTLTEGYRRAAEWLAARYEEFGLEPAGQNGTYFQDVPIGRELIWNTGVPQLSVNGIPFSVHEGDFRLGSASTPATTINSDVVFVGYGISAPDKGLDEYAGVNVRNRIVLALTGSPLDLPEPRRGGFGPGPRTGTPLDADFTAESTNNAKIKIAYEKGAAAILLYNPDEAAGSGMSFGRRSREEGLTPERNFLDATITARVFRAIMRENDQESSGGTTRRVNAWRTDIKYGQTRSQNVGSRVSLQGYETTERFNEELGNNIARNVLAKIPGTDRRLRNQYVIMGGHLDHVGMRDGLVRNGADDNASGTMVALEAARVLSEANFRPRRTIIFAGWCGEEMGLIGSNYYADNPCDGVTMDNTVTYFNMDMVGLGDAIGAPGALNFPTIWEVIKRDQDEDVIAAVRPRTGGPGGSDHSAFITRGIEAMALMTSGGVGHPDYHQPEDDIEKIDPEILRKTGQFVLQGTINLANERRVNLLIEDRLHKYNALMMSIDSFSPGVAGTGYRHIDAGATHAEFFQVFMDSAAAIATRPTAQATQQQQMMRMYSRGGVGGRKKSFARGVNDLSLFGGSLDLMVAGSDVIGYGRIDVEAEDGTWFSGGRLTSQGRAALTAMEENNIFLHLKSPSESLFRDVLGAANRPFLVTGEYTIGAGMVDAINEKQVVLGVTFDPTRVDDCVVQLDGTKAMLGDVDNICLCVTTMDGMDEAKVALYMGLIEKDWTHEEIAGARRAGGGIATGNLTRFSRGIMGGMRR
jgi:hypothetical protein